MKMMIIWPNPTNLIKWGKLTIDLSFLGSYKNSHENDDKPAQPMKIVIQTQTILGLILHQVRGQIGVFCTLISQLN